MVAPASPPVSPLVVVVLAADTLWKSKKRKVSEKDTIRSREIPACFICQQSGTGCSPRLDYRVPFQKEFAAAEGGNVTLNISVIANPTPTFTWYKLTDRNKNLGSGGSSTTDVSAVGKLTLTNVQQEDIGTYQVVVSNGTKNTDLVVNLTLHLAGPPNIPMNVTAWSNGPHSVSVSWIEEFNGGSNQTFLIQYRADTTSQRTNLTKQFPEKRLHINHTAVISNLQPETRYLVWVLAYNKYGYKGFTEGHEALTLAAGEEPSNAALIGGVAGGLTGGVVIIVIVIVLVLLFIRRRNQNSTTSEKPIIESYGSGMVRRGRPSTPNS
ncbi:nephrin-like [Gigantopelta aegis]|uniref:nephrin-like n=1 Tax=Gigantopelta aegis TaxID=1735272 RepID=UPI001B88D7C3|nr:nephrin-like [Gigantopelta aegis]